ncbi:uncharacterized protein F5891DRAFT_1184719 [Suillus fuscotomentosus]|uniref:Uncharacterized protein n=1 Tax=Suillus fuscotomentosus TaxID=1912939 RepID=A0AAD4ECV5_9AGAM|nr:uncharacterized protein F5891DRAFT_1184719 [Suillus fuscotomentosus]KAG1903770.1 hypothetical protein F5891DRAFT_1184719 [Suillus fuscotomentosus]
MARFYSHVVGAYISYLSKQSMNNPHRMCIEEDTLDFWELSNSRRMASISLLSPPKVAVWMQPISPTSSYDMRVACVLQDGAIVVHSLTQEYQPIAGFDTPFYPHGHNANIKCIAYSNMYQLFVTSADGTLSVSKVGLSGFIQRQWSMTSGAEMAQISHVSFSLSETSLHICYMHEKIILEIDAFNGSEKRRLSVAHSISSAVLSPTRDRLLLHNVKTGFHMVDVTTYTSCSLRFHVNAVDCRPLSAAFINRGKHLVAHDGYGKIFFWESASANLLWSTESGCLNVRALAQLTQPGLLEPERSRIMNNITAPRRKLTHSPVQEESGLQSQDNHYGEGLQPSLYDTLSHQTRCSSDNKSSYQDQGVQTDAIEPWLTHTGVSPLCSIPMNPCIQDGLIPNHPGLTHTLHACKIEDLDSNSQSKDANSALPLSSLHVTAQHISIPTTKIIPNDEDSTPEFTSILGAKPVLAIHTGESFLGSGRFAYWMVLHEKRHRCMPMIFRAMAKVLTYLTCLSALTIFLCPTPAEDYMEVLRATDYKCYASVLSDNFNPT